MIVIIAVSALVLIVAAFYLSLQKARIVNRLRSKHSDTYERLDSPPETSSPIDIEEIFFLGYIMFGRWRSIDDTELQSLCKSMQIGTLVCIAVAGIMMAAIIYLFAAELGVTIDIS